MVAASELPPRRPHEGMAVPRSSVVRRLLPVLLALAAGLTGAATAQAQTGLTEAQFKRALFVAGDTARLSESATGLQAVVLEKVLQELYAVAPETDPATAQAAVDGLRQRLEARLDLNARRRLLASAPNAAVLQVISALTLPRDAAELPTSEGRFPPGDVGEAVKRLAITALAESVKPDPRVPGQRFNERADDQATLTDEHYDPATVLGRTVDLAMANERFGRARDLLWQEVSRQSALSSSAQLLAADPALAQLRSFAPATPGGVVAMDTAQLKTLAGDALQDVSRRTTAVVQALKTNESNALLLERVRTDAQARERSQVAATFAAESAAIVSGLAAKRRMAATKTSVITIAKTVGGLAAKLAVGAAIGPAGWAGAAMELGGAIYKLAVPGPPSAEELTLKALGDIQVQIAGLQEEMHERFDRITAQMVELGTQIDELKGITQQTAARVDDVLRELQQIRLELGRIGNTIYDVSRNEEWRKLQEQLPAIGWAAAQADGSALPAGQFPSASFFFFNAATNTAANTTFVPAPDWSGLSARLTTPEGAADLAPNLDLLRQWPGRPGPGLTALGDTTVPNAQLWSYAARAQAQLLLENPGYVTASQKLELAGSTRAGRVVQDLVGRIGRKDTEVRTGSRLFNALLDRHRAATGTLQAAIRANQKALLVKETGTPPTDLPGTTTPVGPRTAITDGTATKHVLPWEGAGQDMSWDPASTRPRRGTRWPRARCPATGGTTAGWRPPTPRRTPTSGRTPTTTASSPSTSRRASTRGTAPSRARCCSPVGSAPAASTSA
jgi:hypothetical protein